MKAALKALLVLGVAPALFFPAAASAAPWTKQYVLEWLEPAFYHGGQPGDQTGPGTDCPEGTMVRPAWDVMLKTPWRAAKDVPFYMDPENRPILQRMIRYRGPNYENVWEEPWKAPDMHMTTVTGKIAYGFDLDGNEKTGGFHSKDGAVKGIDNGYYLVGGCWASYRGHPRQSQRGLSVNGHLRNGLWTTVMVVSGNQDPMNDDDATFAFYEGQETVTKDTQAGVMSDATFNVKPNPRTQSIFKVKIKDGVIEGVGPVEIRMRDEGWNRSQPDQLRLVDGKVRFEMTADGALKGMMGGYRDWKVLYRKQAVNGRDTEMNQAIDLPSFYYSLKRHADYAPDPKTGENTMLSAAYTISAVPAFVMTPDGTEVVEAPRPFDNTPPKALASK